MRRALGLLVIVACGCHTPSASPPRNSTTPAVVPLAHDAEAAPPNPDAGPDPAPPVSSDADASERVAAEPAETATPAAFGQSLKPGLYVFPDGLRLRVEQIAGCDFDTSVPCFGGTYRAHATLGKEEATVEWSTRSALVLRHRIVIAGFRLFTVRR